MTKQTQEIHAQQRTAFNWARGLDLTPSQQLIALALAFGDGPLTADVLADVTELSKKTLYKAIRVMTDGGIISVAGKEGNARLFRLNVGAKWSRTGRMK